MLRIQAKTIDGWRWRPKTENHRAVPISRELRSYLDSLTPSASDHARLFPSPEGTRWDPDYVSRELRASNQKAELPWSSLHYRHPLGSQVAQCGVSLYQLATLMSNSPGTCQRQYAALVPEEIRAQVESSDR